MYHPDKHTDPKNKQVNKKSNFITKKLLSFKFYIILSERNFRISKSLGYLVFIDCSKEFFKNTQSI